MKTRIPLATLVLFLLPVLLPAAPRVIDADKETDIHRLLELTGAEKLGSVMGAQVAEQLKQMLEKTLPPGERTRQILDRFWEKFMAEFDSSELSDRLVPLYDKHLTHEDIKGLIQFYESPLGRRVIKVLPKVMEESYAIGSQWGQEIAQKALREIQEEFPEVPGWK